MRTRTLLPLACLALCAVAADPPQAPFVFRDAGEAGGLLPALSGIQGHGAGWGVCAVAADSPPVPFVFRDAGEAGGLLPALSGIQGHGAGWGDVDGNGWPDLYVGTFHKPGTKTNALFLNQKGLFHDARQAVALISSRTTGVVFADLDNDGDLDLYVGSMPQPKNNLSGCTLFRNEGLGVLTNISAECGACPTAFGGRSVAVLDYDGDGLLDLLVGEDPHAHYNGSPTHATRLSHHLGGLRFEDASRAADLPEIPGLGVAAADVNDDGWPDIFLASSDGGNVLLLNDRHGHFREALGSRELFAWPGSGGDNMVCGVAFADVNRDGRLDLVLGQHFEKPWLQPVAERLFLHRGLREGAPVYEEVTAAAGLSPLPMKGPHVELQDYDNDGWPDLSTSIVTFHEGQPRPVIFRHLGLHDGIPQFRTEAFAGIDFPTAEDRQITRTGPFFDKMVRDHKIIYGAAAPSADYDRDGRLDFFLPSWWADSPSLLLHNETTGGHWLDVRVTAAPGINRQGIGARVKIYRAGQLGQPAALLGCREIAVGFGYASGQEAQAHFGLGPELSVDVEVLLPHQKGILKKAHVPAGQILVLP